MMKTLWNISHLGCWSGVRVADPLWKKRLTPRRLWKYTSLLNYRNCKVDVFTRQGHSGGTPVKPLLFHYVIGTCDVKQRSHADNIIVSLYGREKTMTPCSPQEKRSHFENKRKQKQVDTYAHAHLLRLEKKVRQWVIIACQQPAGAVMWERICLFSGKAIRMWMSCVI